MKNKLMIILGLAMLPLAACAQSDFGGTWVANPGESEPGVDTDYWFGRLSPEVPGQPDLKVEQDGNTISVYEEARVLARYDYPAVYVADGKAHEVTDSGTGLAKISITTNWDGDDLVIDSVKPWGSMPGNITLNSREVWKLSADGKKLSITTTQSSPAKVITYTQVYDRGE
jgi:hypothetical protein